MGKGDEHPAYGLNGLGKGEEHAPLEYGTFTLN